MEEQNARQLVSGRVNISQMAAHTTSSEEQRRLLEAFIDAAQRGDLAALEDLFAEDVVSYSDGGGIVRTAARTRFLAASALRSSLLPLLHISGRA